VNREMDVLATGIGRSKRKPRPEAARIAMEKAEVASSFNRIAIL